MCEVTYVKTKCDVDVDVDYYKSRSIVGKDCLSQYILHVFVDTIKKNQQNPVNMLLIEIFSACYVYI